MNAALSSAIAQGHVATFGNTPPGFRPVPSRAASLRGPADPHTTLRTRPRPGYGHVRRSAGKPIARALVRVGVPVDLGTTKTTPANFMLSSPGMSGMGDTVFTPVKVAAEGNISQWSYSGPLVPLIGAGLGAAFGARAAAGRIKGGAIGAAIGWFVTAGIIASTKAGQLDLFGAKS